MCGRYTLKTDLRALAERFGFEAGGLSCSPRYNIAPTQEVLVVVRDGQNRARLLRWGLVPSWARDAPSAQRIINARAETVAQKPAFRRALSERRCLVLADGFYEWRREGRGKVPFYITLRSREPFGFAGLWEDQRAPSGVPAGSCAIITTAANTVMASIHDRMPVILAPQAESLWLDPGVASPRVLSALLGPYPTEAMEAHRVSTLVNSPASDDPACIRSLD